MATNCKSIEKRHAHNKFVRKQKQLVRRRNHKHKPKKYVIMQLTGLEWETIQKLRDYAKRHHTSVNKAISKILSKFMKEYDGIKSEPEQSSGENQGTETEEGR
jgi:hypothetical protein